MSRSVCRQHGFTLIEVLVALVIVAFGVGAVMAAISSSADNIAALREKSLAQWIALNRMSQVRLDLNAPSVGTTTGEVTNFGNGSWHWQQVISNFEAVPGVLSIRVRVRRSSTNSSSSSSSGGGMTAPVTTINVGSSSADNDAKVGWLATVVGFRGDSLLPASGEQPVWDSGTTSSSGASSSSSSSSSSSGSLINDPGSSSSSSSGASTSGYRGSSGGS